MSEEKDGEKDNKDFPWKNCGSSEEEYVQAIEKENEELRRKVEEYDSIENLIKHKVVKDKIAFLESRLKEANSIIQAKHDYCSSLCCDIANLQDRLKEANDLIWNNKENLRQTNIGWTKTVESIEQRLSQAEAENKRLKDSLNKMLKVTADRIFHFDLVRARNEAKQAMGVK